MKQWSPGWQQRLAATVGLLAIVVVGGVILLRFPPTDHGWYPRCLLHVLTGLHCPGCGSLRALHALAGGHIVAALGANLVLTVGLPLVLWFGVAQIWRWGRLGTFNLGDTRPVWWWIGMIAIWVFGLVRNLPFAPFTWLAP